VNPSALINRPVATTMLTLGVAPSGYLRIWSCQSRRWRRTIGKRRCENGIGPDGMWDEKDGFYYDILHLPDGNATRLKVRSAQ
jgi:hypothetical protein